ncbi:MAG: LicD family protein [Treponema sp.]|jgi:lipopolysaccharide cholinephosphotransferase|nr:LicD family protein [Treponema sp.]
MEKNTNDQNKTETLKEKVTKELDQETTIKLRTVLLELLDEFVRVCEENNLTYFLVYGTLLGAVRHKGFIPWDDDIDVMMLRNDYEKFVDIYDKINNTKYYLLSNRCSITSPHHYRTFAKFCKKDTVFAESEKNPDAYTGIWIDIKPFDNCIRSLLVPQRKLISFTRQAYILRNNIDIPKAKIKKVIIRLIFFIFPKQLLFILSNKFFTLFNKFNTRYISSFSGLCGYKKETHRYDTIFPLTKLEFEGKQYCVPGNWDIYLTHYYGNYMELPPIEQRVTHKPFYIIFENVEDNIPK